MRGRKGRLVRDSIADIESFRPRSPGWPASIGMGGRLPSESVAGLHRNYWPLCVGLRTQGSAINNDGWVVGYAPVQGEYHAFLYKDGKMQDLGTEAML